MRRKRINYDEIINKLDEYLKKKNDKYMLVVISPNEIGYKIQESDGKTPKEFYIENEDDLNKYLQENEKNKNCNILNISVIE